MNKKIALKVGIQGVLASFHDVAAREYFTQKEVCPVEYETFKRLCEGLQNGACDYCMMAIENTIAGSILTNYSLLERYHFRIVGEVYLRIELCLMALAGQKLEDLRFVQSHPMALLQCEDFLFQNPHLKVFEAADTAESAKNIAGQKLNHHGAIASSLAAKTYGLQLLAEGIETNKLNYTRFLVICRESDYKVSEEANKASVRFETRNAPGSLVQVLEIFKSHQINMTKIQSIPILGKPYQYSIHVDLEWQKRSDFTKAMKEISQRAENLIHFGEYLKGERPQL